jgi:hypothetical protein
VIEFMYIYVIYGIFMWGICGMLFIYCEFMVLFLK